MNTIGDHLGTWLAALIVSLLTIFSDKIFGRLRFALNRADLRVKYFEQIATDLSSYLFWSEVYHERFQKGWADNPEDLGMIGGEINGAVTALRRKEYVYRSWVKKYWGTRSAEAFDEVMTAVKAVDDAAHAFNATGEEAEKTETLGRRLANLRDRLDGWMLESDSS